MSIDHIIALFLAIITMAGIAFTNVATLYLILFLWLLSKEIALGKWILGEKVVNKYSGSYPGFWKMCLREIICKLVSVLAFGIGYPWLWSTWDKNHQMWHDKIAGTVVVHTR